MRFLPRTLSIPLKKAARTFPALVVTGPRQSGKTTLLRTLFGKTHRFVSLEDSDVRRRALEDPRAFLKDLPSPLILDEIQYAPDLLSYIKTRIDENRKAAQWVFTGSQNFALMETVSQSLAGRAAVMSLLPFSASEKDGRGLKIEDVAHWLKNLKQMKEPPKKTNLFDSFLRGGFPEIASQKKVDRSVWFGSYITTYLERDVRTLAHVGDLNQFERFLRMCAALTGQILNLSDMARDIGISVPTAKRWLSVLQASYLVFLLYPYYQNMGKRIVKSPKIYFGDVGLAMYLQGLHTREPLVKGPSFGALFETWVVTEVWKRFLHHAQMPSLYYLRTQDGMEIDLVIEEEGKLYCFEIKSGSTMTTKHAHSLQRFYSESKGRVVSAYVLSQDEQSYNLTSDVRHVPALWALH